MKYVLFLIHRICYSNYNWHDINGLYIKKQQTVMLKWTAIFLIIAIIAAIFGFTGIAQGAAEIAKVIFFIFIVLVVLSLVFGATVFGKK